MHPAPPQPSLSEESQPRPAWHLLAFVLASLFTANVLQWAIARALHLGNPGAIKPEVHAFLHVQQWTDSWLPMMKSLDYFHANPTLPIYYANLYDTLIYSLASLLPLVFLRKLGVTDPTLLRILAIASWLAVIGVAITCIAIARRLLRKHNRATNLTWPNALAITLACLGCYPLLKGYALGNAQTFLSLGFAVMLLLWVQQHERSAGVVAALLAFVKPQYVLLLLWMAVRRRWGAAAAFLATAALLILASTLVFGWHNNLDYIAILASLSHKAQTHFANQSMFGTLNRLIFNGENIGYTPHVYTPYIPWVYRVTVLTSLALVAVALFFPWGTWRATTPDIAAMGLVSVAASPMAWEHHYGIVLGLFAWAWFGHATWLKNSAENRLSIWLLALSFFLCTNFLAITNYLAAKPGWNILQSYMYFGALLLLAWLMREARRATHLQRTPRSPQL